MAIHRLLNYRASKPEQMQRITTAYAKTLSLLAFRIPPGQEPQLLRPRLCQERQGERIGQGVEGPETIGGCAARVFQGAARGGSSKVANDGDDKKKD